MSFLVATAPDFQGLDLGALWEDVKVAGTVGLRYRSSWERLAVVTDKDWMRHGVAAFGWVIPGEIRVFDPGELEQAKAWTGGAGWLRQSVHHPWTISASRGIAPGAEREVLDAVGARLDVAHRVGVEADRVPFAELDDLVARP